MVSAGTVNICLNTVENAALGFLMNNVLRSYV